MDFWMFAALVSATLLGLSTLSVLAMLKQRERSKRSIDSIELLCPQCGNPAISPFTRSLTIR